MDTLGVGHGDVCVPRVTSLLLEPRAQANFTHLSVA